MIQEKLDVLKIAGIIDDAVYEYLQAVIAYLEGKGLMNDAEKAEVFLTHLAMASARQQKGESVTTLDATISEQIKNEPQFVHTQDLWKELAAMAPVSFHDNEIDYLYLHICTMLTEI